MLTVLCTSLTLLIASPVETQSPPPTPSGWSVTAGTTGVVTGVAVLTLALAAERLKLVGSVRAIPYAASAVSLGAVVPPLVFLSGWAGRRSSGTRGSPALRVGGWIAYGGFMTVSIATIATGLKKQEPINGMIALLSGFAALSLSLFASDAFVAWRQARRSQRRAQQRRPDSHRTPISWVPWLAPVVTPGRSTTGGLAGLAGWF
jgi:hypothetical protein